MFRSNLEFNFLPKTSDQRNLVFKNQFKDKDENYNYFIVNLNNEINNNDLNQLNKNDQLRGNLTINNNFNNLNNYDLNNKNNLINESQNKYDQFKNQIKSTFRTSWPFDNYQQQQKELNKLNKIRRLSLTEYPKLNSNFDICKQFLSKKENGTRIVKRQNSAPERRRKPFDDTILEEDEPNEQNTINQISNETINNQSNQTKSNQIRSLRRRQARYRTQPITFDEIKEVDETQFNDQDNSINKLINFHISDNLK